LNGKAISIESFFSQDGKDCDHVLNHLSGEGRRARFFLVKEEEVILFPKYSKRGKLKQIGKIGSSGFDDLLDLNARTDRINGRPKHVQIFKNQPQ